MKWRVAPLCLLLWFSIILPDSHELSLSSRYPESPLCRRGCKAFPKSVLVKKWFRFRYGVAWSGNLVVACGARVLFRDAIYVAFLEDKKMPMRRVPTISLTLSCIGWKNRLERLGNSSPEVFFYREDRVNPLKNE